MLIAVRHCRTNYNEDGKERLRGWLPLPLSTQGREEAYETAQKVRQARLPIRVVLTSPVVRAKQTAAILGRGINRPVVPLDGAKDWNVGAFVGKDAMDTLPAIHALMRDPSRVPPQGESYETFRTRALQTLVPLMQASTLHLVVTHNRLITLLLATTTHDPARVFQPGPVEPGGVMQFSPTGTPSIIWTGNAPDGEEQRKGA